MLRILNRDVRFALLVEIELLNTESRSVEYVEEDVFIRIG